MVAVTLGPIFFKDSLLRIVNAVVASIDSRSDRLTETKVSSI